MKNKIIIAVVAVLVLLSGALIGRQIYVNQTTNKIHDVTKFFRENEVQLRYKDEVLELDSKVIEITWDNTNNGYIDLTMHSTSYEYNVLKKKMVQEAKIKVLDIQTEEYLIDVVVELPTLEVIQENIINPAKDVMDNIFNEFNTTVENITN